MDNIGQCVNTIMVNIGMQTGALKERIVTDPILLKLWGSVCDLIILNMPLMKILEIRLNQYLDTVCTQQLFATVGSLIKYINQNIGNKILLWKD